MPYVMSLFWTCALSSHYAYPPAMTVCLTLAHLQHLHTSTPAQHTHTTTPAQHPHTSTPTHTLTPPHLHSTLTPPHLYSTLTPPHLHNTLTPAHLHTPSHHHTCTAPSHHHTCTAPSHHHTCTTPSHQHISLAFPHPLVLQFTLASSVGSDVAYQCLVNSRRLMHNPFMSEHMHMHPTTLHCRMTLC